MIDLEITKRLRKGKELHKHLGILKFYFVKKRALCRAERISFLVGYTNEAQDELNLVVITSSPKLRSGF